MNEKKQPNNINKNEEKSVIQPDNGSMESVREYEKDQKTVNRYSKNTIPFININNNKNNNNNNNKFEIFTKKCSSAIRCKVNEEREEIKILLDGGAEVNCISLSFAIIMELQTYQWDGKITNASSKAINHHGYTYFKIKVGKEEKIMPFVVIDSIGEYELLLGTPGLEQTKMIIDYGRGEARSDERAYLLIADKPESHHEDRFRVIAREDGVVPKRSMKKFSTKIENQKDYEEAIRRRKNKKESFQFIPAKVLSQTSLRLPEAIVEASGEKVQDVVISNVADTEVNIKKGALIGYVKIPRENHATRKLFSINYEEEDKISEDLEEETYIPEVDAEDVVVRT